jgi:hypothetical protein
MRHMLTIRTQGQYLWNNFDGRSLRPTVHYDTSTEFSLTFTLIATKIILSLFRQRTQCGDRYG